MLKKGLSLLVLLLMMFDVVQSQVAGCTDPRATNFNPTATINNGSCVYPITVTNPPFICELPGSVKETSGLLKFNNKLWTFNDSGGSAVLYAMDTTDAHIVQQITVSNATNVDWEDITMDDQYIYIADIGNNNGTRKDLVVYRILKSSVPVNGNSTVQAASVKFVYEDQQSFQKTKEHNFDCEAIVATQDSLYLFTKNRADQQCNLYRLPSNPGNHIAKKIDNFNSNGLITGADYDPVHQQLILTGYTQQTYVPFVWMLFDFKGRDFFGGNKRRVELLNLITTQIEGVAYSGAYSAYISAEKSQSFSARLFRLNTGEWTGLTGVSDENAQDSKKMNLIENPVRNGELKLRVDFRKEDFRLDIHDSTGKVLKQLHLKKGSEEVLSIDVNGLKPGTYFITAFTERRSYHTSFIIN